MTKNFDILKEYFYGSAFYGVNYENKQAYRIVKYLNFIRNKLSTVNQRLIHDVDTTLHTNSRMSSPDFVKNASNRIIFFLEEIFHNSNVQERAGELASLIYYDAADYFDLTELKRKGVELSEDELKRFKYLFDNHALVVSTLRTMGA